MPDRMQTIRKSWTRIASENVIAMSDPMSLKRVELADNGEFDVFNLKGPMGKGLCIEDHGVHVAFCAGTRVLVFLDLVSHLLLRAYYKHYCTDTDQVPIEMFQLKDDFTFLFYVSMLSMDSEIGLSMCEALEKVNRKLGETNFKLTVRISKRWDGMRGQVWDQAFVEQELKPYAG